MAARMGSLQSSVAMYKAQSNTDPIKLPGNTHPPHRFHGLPGTTQFSYFHHVSFCTGSMEIRTWKLRRQKAHFGNDVQCPSSLTEGPANPQGHLAVGQQSCSTWESLLLPRPTLCSGGEHPHHTSAAPSSRTPSANHIQPPDSDSQPWLPSLVLHSLRSKFEA